MTKAMSKIAQAGAVRKRCEKCGREKSSGEFSLRSQSVDGLQPWCRICARNAERKRKSMLITWMDRHNVQRVISIREYAEKHDIGQERVRRMCVAGELLAVNVGQGKVSSWKIADEYFNAAPVPTARIEEPSAEPTASHAMDSSVALLDLTASIATLEGYAMAVPEIQQIAERVSRTFKHYLRTKSC